MNQSVISLKIILAGNHQCGKTLFMLKWKDPEGQHTPQTTIATELTCQTVTINDQVFKIQLWDTAGQEAYHSITAPYFRSCKGVFLVFDVTNHDSFESLDYWLGMIQENTNEMPLIVVLANKIDMPDHAVEPEEISKYCRDHDLPFFMISAWTGENVKNAADYMINNLAESSHVVNQADTIHIDNTKPQNQNCC